MHKLCCVTHRSPACMHSFNGHFQGLFAPLIYFLIFLTRVSRHCGILTNSPKPRLIGRVVTGRSSTITYWGSLSARLLYVCRFCIVCWHVSHPVYFGIGSAWGEKVSSTFWSHVKSRTADCSGAVSPGLSWRKDHNTSLLLLLSSSIIIINNNNNNRFV